MRDFRNLKTWQLAHRLTLDVYRLTHSLPPAERYGLTAQIRRAAVSIGANIVEGSARPTNASLRSFLSIAQGSAAELEYLLLVVNDLGYISPGAIEPIAEEIRNVRRMLSGFARSLPKD